MSIPPRCQGCGYDLSGAVDSWRDRCPLEGVCPECGQRIAWGEPLRFRNCPWLFERTGPRLVRRLFITIRRASCPWSFFKAIREVRGRSTDALSSGMMILLVMHAFTLGAAYLGRGANPICPYLSGPYGPHVPPHPIVGLWGSVCFLATAFVPLILAALPMSWRVSGVRRREIIRPASYSMVLPLVMMLVMGVAWLIDVRHLDRRLQAWAGVDWIEPLWWRMTGRNVALWPVAYGVGLVLFWWFALKDYVRLKGPLAAAGVTAVLAVIAGAMVVALAGDRPRREAMYWDLYPVSRVVSEFLAPFGVEINGEAPR